MNYNRGTNNNNGNELKSKNIKCRLIFLVTNDIFLFYGLRSFLPGIIFIKPDESKKKMAIYAKVFSSVKVEYAVILDNRISFIIFNWFISNSFNKRKCISTLLIDMKGEKCARLYVGEDPKINSLYTCEIIDQINKYIIRGDKINYTQAFDRYKLSDVEIFIIQYMLNGHRIKDISKLLNVKEKELYDLRCDLFFRFGFKNFNSVCLFIFRNKIMDDAFFHSKL